MVLTMGHMNVLHDGSHVSIDHFYLKKTHLCDNIPLWTYIYIYIYNTHKDLSGVYLQK